MDMMGTGTTLITTLLFVVLAIMAVAVVCIVAMLLSISKSGDERRRRIVEKTCANTFLITVGVLLLSVIENLVRVFALQAEIHKINPIVFLMVVAVLYAVQLLYYKKKFGD